VKPGTIVVALGGNAVAPPGERPTIGTQFHYTRASLAPIVELARAGWQIALVHGNGPQVGDELARNEIGADQVEPLPLGVLVAGTAGWMGYMIQQSLQNALAKAGVARHVVTLITQTLCDANDPDLRTPIKPIGHPLDPVRIARLQARGATVREDRLEAALGPALTVAATGAGDREKGEQRKSGKDTGNAGALVTRACGIRQWRDDSLSGLQRCDGQRRWASE